MTGVFFAILFGLIFVSFPCKGQISLPPGGDTFYVLPGQNVTLAWTFNASGILARTWTFLPNTNNFASIVGADGSVTKSAQYSPGPFSIKKPSTLILENVNIQYNGTYKFFVVASATYSSYVTVIVEVKANVTINCTNSLTVVNEGDDFTYLCETKGGNPPANVTWKKDGLPEPGRSGKEQNILTRVNVSGADSGTYTCVAKGHTLTNNISCEVKVRPNAKPGNTNITLTPKTVKVGENVTITCESNGVPEPKYNITHNGTEISTEKTYIIPMVNKTHAGTYKCFVWNKLGNDSDSDTLTVEGQITPTPTISTPTISTPSTSYAATSSITSNGTEPAPTTRPTTPPSSAPTSSSTGGLSTGAIIGIIIGVLVLIIIVVVVVVYYCKSKEKERSNNSANIDPVPGNGHELEEPGPSDGAYDTVWTSGSKSKAPVENALPPVYAAVDKNNRQGNTLYASLDNKALQSSRASKKEPDRPQQTEYASIDFAKTGNAPKTV